MATLDSFLSTMTMGELEELEQVVGRPMTQWLGEGTMEVPIVSAAALIVLRRTKPAATPADVKMLTLAEFERLASPATPTQPAARGGKRGLS